MRYNTYFDSEGNEIEFTVFIIHGHSKELYNLERFIRDQLKFNVKILLNDFTGEVILDKFRNAAWEDVDCVVALMSPDDKLDNGNFRARQNVFYELGYCQAVFDFYNEEDEFEHEQVIVIKEKSIDFREVSDLLGLEVLNYTDGNIESVFYKLGKAINNVYNELKDV